MKNKNITNEMLDISMLVGCKNNLEYTKHFYTTTRNIYTDAEIVFVSYGSTDGTNDWLLKLAETDKNVIVHVSGKSKTLSDTYNKAAKIATKTWMVFCHNDMVIATNFLETLLSHLKPKRCVTYTTIEPPIFPGSRPGKLLANFGNDLESFKYQEFIDACSKVTEETLYHGWAFFMSMNRQEYLDLGGMDNLFNPMFCEDDDLHLRLKLNDYEFKISSTAFAYHFVSKTSRFSDEYKDTTSKIELKSNRNFIRKWGFRNSIFNVKRDNAIVLQALTRNSEYDFNSLYQVIYNVEPFASKLYIENNDVNRQIVDLYISNEQSNAGPFSLRDKIVISNDVTYNVKYCVVIDFTSNKFDIRDCIESLNVLSDMITESNPEPGTYELNPYSRLVVFIK